MLFLKRILTILWLISLTGVISAQKDISTGFNNLNIFEEYDNVLFNNQVNTNFWGNNAKYTDESSVVKKKKFKTSGPKILNSQNPRISNPIGINVVFAGPVYIGISASYFIKSEINLKIGGGMSGALMGMEYHIMGFRNNPWTPYTGFFATYSFEGYAGIYIPIGFQFLHLKGFSFGFELAFWMRDYLDANDLQNIQLEYLISGSLRFGYYF